MSKKRTYLVLSLLFGIVLAAIQFLHGTISSEAYLFSSVGSLFSCGIFLEKAKNEVIKMPRR